eukprot:2743195-Amphidinium_carterae.1
MLMSRSPFFSKSQRQRYLSIMPRLAITCQSPADAQINKTRARFMKDITHLEAAPPYRYLLICHDFKQVPTKPDGDFGKYCACKASGSGNSILEILEVISSDFSKNLAQELMLAAHMVVWRGLWSFLHPSSCRSGLLAHKNHSNSMARRPLRRMRPVSCLARS